MLLNLKVTNTYLCLIFLLGKLQEKIIRSNENIIKALIYFQMAQCSYNKHSHQKGIFSSAILTILSFKHFNQSYIKTIPCCLNFNLFHYKIGCIFWELVSSWSFYWFISALPSILRSLYIWH